MLAMHFAHLLTSRQCTAVLGWDVVQTQIPAVDFVHKYENVFAFKYVPAPPHAAHTPHL